MTPERSNLEGYYEGCYAGYEDWLTETARAPAVLVSATKTDSVTLTRTEYDRLMSKISRLENDLFTKDAELEFKRAEWNPK